MSLWRSPLIISSEFYLENTDIKTDWKRYQHQSNYKLFLWRESWKPISWTLLLQHGSLLCYQFNGPFNSSFNIMITITLSRGEKNLPKSRFDQALANTDFRYGARKTWVHKEYSRLSSVDSPKIFLTLNPCRPCWIMYAKFSKLE